MSHMPAEITLCTTSEIARRFNLNPSTVRRWVLKGQLTPTATTPGGHHRFDLAEVERSFRARDAAKAGRAA